MANAPAERATILIDKRLHQQTRIAAALQGTSIVKFVESAVKAHLATVQTLITAPTDHTAEPLNK